MDWLELCVTKYELYFIDQFKDCEAAKNPVRITSDGKEFEETTVLDYLATVIHNAYANGWKQAEEFSRITQKTLMEDLDKWAEENFIKEDYERVYDMAIMKAEDKIEELLEKFV